MFATLALVYNLVRHGSDKRGRTPEPPEYGREQARAAALLERWREEDKEGERSADEGDGADGRDEDNGGYEYDETDEEDAAEDGGYGADADGRSARPEKLVYPLEHAYTPAELGFATLKGADAAAARLLEAAAREARFDLLLAQPSIEESGAAEYADYSWSRRGRHVEDQFEAGEVEDRTMTLSGWQRPGGEPCALGPIPVEEEEVSPPDACDDLVPD